MLRSFLIVVGSVSGVALLGVALFGEPASTVRGVQQAVSGETETAAPFDPRQADDAPRQADDAPRQADDAAIRARIADLRLEVATLTKSVATLQDQAAQESSSLDALRQKRQAAQQSLERVESEQAHTRQLAADEAAQQAAAQKTQAEQEAARQEAARKAAAEQKAAQVAAAQKAAEEQAAAEQAAAQKAAEAQAQQIAAQRQKAEEEAARRAAVEAAEAQQLAAQRQKAEQEAAQKMAADRAAAEKAAQLAASRKATQQLEIEHAAAHQKSPGSPTAETQYASRNSAPPQVAAGSGAFPAGSAAIIARALPPPPASGRASGATQDNRDLGEAQTVLNRLRHQASASSRAADTTGPADAPPDPASIEAQQRLQRIRARLEQANGALSAGQYEDAQRLLQQVQLQLVFQPPGADQYDAGRTSRAAGDVARALGALGNRDPSGALRAIHQASESLGGSTPRMADADGRPMPFAFSPR